MAEYKGLTIKFAGDDSELSSTLHNISESAKKAQAHLTGINSALKFDPSSAALAAYKVKDLGDAYTQAKNRADAFRSALEIHKDALAKTRELMKRLKDAGEENSDEYRVLAERCEVYEHNIEKLSEDLAISEAKEKAAGEAAKMYGASVEEANVKAKAFGGGLQTLGGWAQSAGDKLISLGTAMSTIAGISAVTVGRKIIDETEEYGNAISQVGVYLGVEGDALEHMSDLALHWGKETQYSATEAAQAMSELAKGGLSAVEIEGGAMAATMDLAAAGQMDLADAALTVAQSMRAFGLQASDTTEVADALAGVANGTTSTVEGLANGFRYVAGWSRLSSWDIHEVSGALGLLADYGLQGEMAGTALRNVLMRLAAPTDKARGIMEEYGIEVRDAEGHMKSAVEVIDQLNAAFEGVSEEERDAALNAMFGARGINAASALMDAGSEALQEYIDLSSEAGAASEMAKGQMGDLGWALEYLRGEAETAAVNVGNALTPMLVDAANAAEDLLEQFNALSSGEQLDIAKKFGTFLLAGPALVVVGHALKGIGGGLSGLGGAITYVSELRAQLSMGGGLAAALGRTSASLAGFADDGLKAAAATKAAAGSLTALKFAVGAALVLLVAIGAYAAWKKMDDARKRTEKLSNAMDVLSGSVRDSGRELDNAADEADGAKRSIKELRDEVEELADQRIELAVEIEDNRKKLNTSVSMLEDARDTVLECLDDMDNGVELSAEQQGELTTALQVLESQYGITFSMGEEGLSYINDEGEAVRLTRDAVYELCDAKLYEMRLNALSNEYTSLYEQRAGELDAVAQATKDVADAQAELDRLNAMTPEQKREEFGTFLNPDGLAGWNEAVVNATTSLDEANKALETYEGYLDDTDEALEDLEYLSGAVAASQDGSETIGQWAVQLQSLQDAAKLSKKSITDFGIALDNAGVDADTMKGILQGLSEEQMTQLVSQFDGTSESIRNSLGAMTGDFDLFSSGWQTTISSVAESTGRSEAEIIAAITKGIEDGTISASTTAEGLGRVLTESIGAEDARDAGARGAKSVIDGFQSELGKNHNQGSHVAENIQRMFESAFTAGVGKARLAPISSGSISGVINNPANLHAAAQAGEAITDEAASAAEAGYGPAMKRIQWGRMTRSAVVTPVSREMQSVGKLSGGWGKQLSSNFASGMTGVSISSRAANMMYATQTAMRIYEKTSYTWGYDMMQNFANGMGAGKSAVLAKAIETANGIKDFMGFSVPKLGPLHDEDVWGVHMMQNFADGMYRALPQVERASLAMAEAVQQPTIDFGYEEGRFLTGVAENVRANQNVNIYFDGINVNDNPAIRNAFIDLMYEANRLGAMNGGKR